MIDPRDAEPTLAHTVVALRERHDRGPIFLHGDEVRRVTFAELAAEAEAHARALLAAGARPGERIGLVLPDPHDFLVAFLGAARLGCVPVPLADAAALRDPDEWQDHVAHLLRAAGARRAVLARVRADLGPTLTARVDGLEVHVLDDMSIGVDAGVELPPADSVDPDDLAFLQFTSGSTGRPRGVRVTHRMIAANAHAIMVDGLGSGADDVGVCWLPLHHDMGLIGFALAPLRYRVPVVFMPPAAFIKHPRRWMEAVHRFRGTITFAPNFAFVLALRRPPALTGLDLSCLRVLGCGAEPIAPAAVRAFLDHFAPAGLRPDALLPSYGLAEATLAVAFAGLGEGLRVDRIAAPPYRDAGCAEPASDGEPALEHVVCGRALPGHRVRVVDDDGGALPVRQVGHLVVDGPSVAVGYESDPAGSAGVFRAAGLWTGDRGYLIEDGSVVVTGRSKDLVIIHGRNYDPQDIERVVAQLPGVRDGRVVAFSRPGLASEELVLAVEARVDARADFVRDLQARVGAALGLAVADVVLVPAGGLPRTTSGKLQRGRARALYLDGQLEQKDMSP